MGENEKISNPNLKIWKCICCQATLGFVERGEVVRVKRQDLYVEFQGGCITINCYRCGKRNYLNDEKKDVIDLKEAK